MGETGVGSVVDMGFSADHNAHSLADFHRISNASAVWGQESQLSRFCAVLGIVGFFDVPLIYLSVKWWRTQHPPHFILIKAASGPTLEPSMFKTLMVSLAAMTLFFLYVLSRRIVLTELRDEVDSLRKAVRD